MDNDWYWIIMRFLHIGPGTFWVGASIMIALFLEPSISASGSAGGQVMSYMTERRKFSAAMGLTSWISVLAGIAVYWRTSLHFNWDWITTGYGTMLSIGGIAAIIALLGGTFGIARTAKEMSDLGKSMQSAEGPPSATGMERMTTLQERLQLLSRIEAALLIIAIGTMAVARYVTF